MAWLYYSKNQSQLEFETKILQPALQEQQRTKVEFITENELLKSAVCPLAWKPEKPPSMFTQGSCTRIPLERDNFMQPLLHNIGVLTTTPPHVTGVEEIS